MEEFPMQDMKELEKQIIQKTSMLEAPTPKQ